MNRFITYGGLILAMIFWSVSFVWSKVALETYPPISIVFTRLAISSALLFSFLAATKKLDRIKKSDIKYFMIMVFFQPFLYFIGESYGLLLVSPTTASVIVSTIPLFTPFSVYFFLKEKITIYDWAGIILSMAGIYLVVAVDGLKIEASPSGIALLFLAVFSAITYAVFLKKLSARYNAASVIAYQNLIATIYFLPLVLIFESNKLLSVNHNFEAIKSIIYLAVFASTLAFIGYTNAVKKMNVLKVIIFVNIIPVFTVLFSYFIVDEKITLQKIAGIIIVIAGVFVSQIKMFRKSTSV